MTFIEYIKELLKRPKPHGVPKGYLLVKRSYLESFYKELVSTPAAQIELDPKESHEQTADQSQT
jgi:hypothetical protein